MRGIRKTFYLFLIVGLFGLSGCSSPASVLGEGQPSGTEPVTEAGQKPGKGMSLIHQGSMDLQYARNFSVDYYEGGYTLLTTKENGAKYLIVPENQRNPEGAGEDGDVVPENQQEFEGTELDKDVIVLRRPVKGIYLVASSVMDTFRALDGMDTISFSGQKEEGWYIAEAREAMKRGDILYAGKYNKPDYELLLSHHCTLAIENRMVYHSPEVIEKLEDFGIPVITDDSSYESHPLARVEWVKFYGALLGKEEEAEKIFKEQVSILERVSAVEKTEKTVAFFFVTSNGLVQVRQSSDYVPKMIELAGGKYVFEHLGDPETKRSTMNLSVEEFYRGAKDADFLLYNSSIDGGVSSIEGLLDKCSLLEDFKAVKEGNVWCTTNDLYQQSLSIGYLMEDIHGMLQGNREEMHYLFPLR